MQQKKQNNKPVNSFIRYSSLAFEMMAIIAICTFGGYKIDEWLEHDFKTFTLIFVILSVLISIIYGTRSILKK